ncbi:MAG: malectin domain-containing carbohydrate-binding protein [Armatimonadota bacterium]|nr:malectin domain-containing carbohydrate-binding protein [Armatimonadota bacterium]
MVRRIVIAVMALSMVALCVARDEEYRAVRAELEGATSLWTVDTPVLETTEDAKYQTERYGEDFTYVLHGLPPGPARLKLGLCENRWTEPGERVFDVQVNGRTVIDDYDILEHTAMNEAVTVSADITIPEGEPLRVRFVAETDNAKVNVIRIYTAEWVLETTPRDEKSAALQPEQRDLPASEDVWETQLGRLGSRVAINPRPQRGVWWQSPLGHAEYRSAYFDPETVDFAQQPARYIFGVKVGDLAISMPFDDRLPHFSKIDQSETMTRLSYECSSPELPVDVRFTWGAPFYPQDVKLSVAPYLTLEVAVTGNDPQEQSGQVLIGRSLPIGDPMMAFSHEGITGLRRTPEVFEIPTEERWVVDETEGVHLHTTGLPLGEGLPEDSGATEKDSDGRVILPLMWDQPYGGLAWDFTVQPGETRRCRIVYIGWVDGTVQTINDVEHRFKYHELFDSPDVLARYAFDNWDEIQRRCAVFERTVSEATIPEALRQFLAFATHSYLVNTWWTISPEGRDWFTVWEGCCQLQSTVDVEYNVAPLYFHMWPELLRMELDEWVGHIWDGVLAHDMGVGLQVDQMAYWHPMEIEENTNFVLLLHQYWAWTGDEEAVRRHFESVRELLKWVTDADTDGDGFPEQGLYNTIDQGSAAIQYASDQVYLAVRSMAAYAAGARMAELVGRPEDATRWTQRVRLTARTLAQEGWLDDHYVVALNQTRDVEPAAAPAGPPVEDYGMGGDFGMMDGGAGEYAGYDPVSMTETAQPISGWDSYSIYTTNGLLYPMRSGMEVGGLDLERLRRDLRRAAGETMQGYGSPHTSHEENMWVSQNIWRDMAAAYLGIDYVDNIERYWDLQRYINTRKFGAFTDVYVYGRDSTSLDYYPRGVAAYGLYAALAGLQFDRTRGVLSLSPLRTPLRLPLTMFADWEAERIPWLIVEGDPSEPAVRIEGGELPEGMQVRLRPRGQPFADGERIQLGGE